MCVFTFFASSIAYRCAFLRCGKYLSLLPSTMVSCFFLLRVAVSSTNTCTYTYTDTCTYAKTREFACAFVSFCMCCVCMFLQRQTKPNHLTPGSLTRFPLDNWSLTASSGKVNDWENRKHVVLNLFSNIKMSEPLVQELRCS